MQILQSEINGPMQYIARVNYQIYISNNVIPWATAETHQWAIVSESGVWG